MEAVSVFTTGNYHCLLRSKQIMESTTGCPQKCGLQNPDIFLTCLAKNQDVFTYGQHYELRLPEKENFGTVM